MTVFSALPADFGNFFEYHVAKCEHITLGEGSLSQSYMDSQHLLDLKKNASCPVFDIDASDSGINYNVHRRYEAYFDSDEVALIRSVYEVLYPGKMIGHIPMFHERFHELKVFNEMFLSVKSRGNHSSAVSAYWAGVGGNLLLSCFMLELFNTLLDTL